MPEAPELPNMRALAEAMSLVLDRCVWSQTQSHASLVTYLIEESYELVDAVEAADSDAMLEELGDVLLQIAFHAEIAARTPAESFTLDEVARVAHEKMVRRHPHVFAGEHAPTIEDVLRLWSAAKSAEKRDRASVLDGIPPQLPALALADKVIGRAERANMLPEEYDSTGAPDAAADEEQLGRQLLGIVRDARARGLDAERALRGAVRRLSDDVRRAEGSASGRSSAS
ncbi:XTP/dITP diphosphohydrolase [Paramicrobacterium humi]|uniref:XTP/dITP diphosphohydrolase n=1 Tax=Paramicrobacterium humi TaxID=640635 RepID=A0A1H4IMZ0_9MICO|nr:MazG family protein [Microbacterium humi]SEB35464.1 XTP/dITP diphosphohydrolase [Microbacterium humi]